MKDKSYSWEESVAWLRDQPGNDELVRNCYYDDPVSSAAERFYQSEEWQEIRRLINSPGGKALDVGAGRGISSYALARDGWDVYALEPDKSKLVGSGAIQLLMNQSGIKLNISEETGECLPFEEDTFDLVYCRAALHHADNLEKLCSEMGRVLKDGGIFLATREHVISHKNDLVKFQDAHPLHHLYGGEKAFLIEEYTHAIQSGGVKIKKIFGPYQSIINMFPETLDGVKLKIARTFHFPFPSLIPDWLVRQFGNYMNQPGRLYSFFGVKRHVS